MRWLRFIGATALVIVAFPFAVIAGLLSKGRNCTAQELAADLQKLSDGNDECWDCLESVPIKDPRLEAIRQEALKVNLPLGAEDRAKLGELAAQTRALGL
jgi:hypothetical protein